VNSILKNKGVWLGILISVVCLVFFFRKVPVDKLLPALAKAEYLWLIPALFITLFSYVVRSIRWRYFLTHLKMVPVWPLFVANMIGFMANNVLPARIGEFARAFVLGRKEGLSMSACFASIFVERLFDFLTILFLLALIAVGSTVDIGLGESVALPEFVLLGSYAAMLISLVLIVGLLLLRFRGEFMLRLSARVTFFLSESWQERIRDVEENFISGINLFQNMRTTLIAVFWSLFMWLTFVFNLYCIFYAFGIYDFSFLQATFVIVALAFAIMIPAGPGFIGTYHVAVQKCTEILFPGIEPGISGGVAVLLHLLSFIPITLIGIAHMALEGISFGEMERKAREQSKK
jgi:glycosyltransferase 2 family protein